MSFSRTERARLVDTFREVGPNAPTECEGWTAHHLAAHLLLRETSPLATAGMFLSPLAGVTDKAMQRQLDRPFAEVVAQWGRGPRGLWRLLDRKANVAEHFVHHEDVRRAQGLGPRSFTTAESRELYDALRNLKVLLRASQVAVELRPEGFPAIAAGQRDSEERVVISGQVGEILLYLYGRPAQGLDFVGDVEKIKFTSL
ncbi:TIGR03085 family protein [Corynebacterium hindlerae]|uniref:TIGR03085 family metal-binding protein n=1 Tax=Corynebacterium hindlerae TaxID=699041 RepID=UPI001AD663E8|nr:TIGR03085 family metal-binding protein [Corynebacterium hindlerae]QTH58622.1 TIGR03085 family protein [Corynebacterium hindlerae]